MHLMLQYRPTSAFLLSFALLVTLVAGAEAQGSATSPTSDPSGPASTFGEVIDVRVVNLEVVVTRDGDRVRGLTPDDFELVVDDRTVAVEYFSEVSGGVAVAPDASRGDGSVPALAPGDVVGTSFLVFIDEYFPLEKDRDRVLDGLIAQLPNLLPKDRMAVVAFDGSRIEMLNTWTSSVRELTRTLRQAKLRPTQGLERKIRNRSFDTRRDLGELALGQSNRFDDGDAFAEFVSRFDAELTLEQQQFGREVFAQTDRAVRAAAATLRSFARPQGRKIMLLMSGGWPSDPTYWATTDRARSARESRTTRGIGLLSPLVETANLLGYTLYPVDVPGTSGEIVDASTPIPSFLATNLGQGQAREREREEEAALVQLARETGGKALLDGNRDRAFEAVISDTRSYYWLGFTPNWQGDDSAHKVRVRVKGKDIDVRTRRSFSDLSRSTEVTMMVESALRLGDPPSAAALPVQIKSGARAGFGKRVVTLKVALPLGELVFLPNAEGFGAEAELRVAVLDETGTSTEIPVIPMSLKAKTEPTSDDFSIYETEIKMRRERHDLVVSLYDRISGRILASKTEVPAHTK